MASMIILDLRSQPFQIFVIKIKISSQVILYIMTILVISILALNIFRLLVMF